MDLEMNRENVIKLSVAGAVLLVAVIVFFTIGSKPKEKVVEDAPVSEPGAAGPDRVRPNRGP